MAKDFKDLRKKISIDRKTEIPEHSAELPYLKRRVSYRSMKNKELKSFLKALEKRDEYAINASLDAILDSCVTTIEDEPFNNDDLCIQDRTFLLIKVRQATLGDIAKFPHVYAEDKDPVEVDVDISEFPVVYREEPVDMVIKLSSGVRVYLGPVCRGTEKSMEAWTKKNASRDSVVDRRYCAYAALIEKVEINESEEGESENWEEVDLTFDDKVKFIEEYCSPSDIDKFDKVSDELDFGIKLTFSFKHDGYENEEEEINLLSFFIT